MSPSMMQLKEKCMDLTSLKNIQLTDGWGWFIDIESNNNNILLTQFNRQTSKPISIPQPIKEELINEKTFNEETFKEDTFEEETTKPFKSIKSMGKLHDDSMIFEMDVEVHDKKKEKSNKIFRIIKSLFIIGIICVFYGFILL